MVRDLTLLIVTILNYSQVAVRLNVNIELFLCMYQSMVVTYNLQPNLNEKKMKNRTHFHNGLYYYKSGAVQLRSAGK